MADGIQSIGRLMIVVGLTIAAAGVFFMFSDRIPWLGRLPGDILVRRKNVTFYFPLATSILISFFLTLFCWIFGRK